MLKKFVTMRREVVLLAGGKEGGRREREREVLLTIKH
jgi:hypothetical protein